MIQADSSAISGKSLYLDGSSGLILDEIAFGGCDFTIDGWVYMDSENPAYGRIFLLRNKATDNLGFSFFCNNENPAQLTFYRSQTADYSTNFGGVATYDEVLANQRVHFALVYIRSANTVKYFINGKQFCYGSNVAQYNRSKFKLSIGYQDNRDDRGVKGTIEHFRIYDGLARWTADFTPPTASDYT